MTILVDSTSSPSYHWLLRYNSTETDWDFIGGAPGFDEVTADQTTSSTSYTDLSTTGPSFALPVAGDYDIAIGFSRGATDNAADQIFMSYAIGGTAAVDADAVMGSGQTARFSPMRVRRKTGLTAVTLTAKYRSVAAAAESFANRWISVTPKRLTP
jgi:hypothetical protein